MSDYYVGQIMMTGFNFAQLNFLQCNGQLTTIAQNQALFALLGTYYGGDGVNNFALPDLRSRTPVGGGFNSVDPTWQPSTVPLGAQAGTETVTLTAEQLPSHTHLAVATSAPGSDTFNNGQLMFAQLGGGELLYGAPNALMPLSASPTSSAGGGQPHANMQPFEVVNFNICQYGLFPPHN